MKAFYIRKIQTRTRVQRETKAFKRDGNYLGDKSKSHHQQMEDNMPSVINETTPCFRDDDLESSSHLEMGSAPSELIAWKIRGLKEQVSKDEYKIGHVYRFLHANNVFIRQITDALMPVIEFQLAGTGIFEV